MARKMVIGLDFDGTLVRHAYPYVGEDIGAFEWLRRFQKRDVHFVLFTMRDSYELQDAVKHCEKNGITLWGIQTNPEQSSWTTSPKAHCHLFIDDRGLGIPLDDHGAVDWSKAGPLAEKAIIEYLSA